MKMSQTSKKISKTEVSVFLENLSLQITKCENLKKPENNCEIYRHVLQEYSEFTKFYLNLNKCMMKDLNIIQINTLDDNKREHYVEITINYDDSRNIFEITEYDLPCEKDYFQRSSNLRTVYEYFTGMVENLQPFFNLMDILDSVCCILDPLTPKRRINYRRIWLGENISVIITVDPFNVALIPEIKFLGPEKLAESYRMTVNANLVNWNSANDPLLEILQLIGLDKFPQRTVQTQQSYLLMDSGDCSICFSQRLNDKIPEVSCKSEFCGTLYHIDCLYEWLMSVNTRRYFSEIIGNCPNCEKTISCPIPS